MKNVTIYGKATLEILAAVYANNKNIPQATKDLVQLKYVETLKLEAGYKIDEEVKAAGEAEENTENTDAETVEEG